jgi:hypothetical protein
VWTSVHDWFRKHSIAARRNLRTTEQRCRLLGDVIVVQWQYTVVDDESNESRSLDKARFYFGLLCEKRRTINIFLGLGEHASIASFAGLFLTYVCFKFLDFETKQKPSAFTLQLMINGAPAILLDGRGFRKYIFCQ